MRLPVPIFDGERAWTDAELRAPTPATIANTQEAMQKGLYRGVISLCAGVVAALSCEGERTEDRTRIAGLVRRMPYASAEPLSVYALLEGDADDGIEGVYPCPRCGRGQVVCEFVSEDEDTRDHVRALKLVCQGDGRAKGAVSRTLDFDLSAPVTLTGPSAAGDPPVVASSFTMRYPTLADCAEAEAQVPSAQASLRQQMAIYSLAVERINGEAMTAGVLGTLSKAMVDGMPKADLRRLGEEVSRYGLDSFVSKTCPACGKVWQARINTSNFFVSALVS